MRSLFLDLPNAQLILDSPLERLMVQRHVRAFLNGDDQPFPLLMQILMTALAWEAVHAAPCHVPDAALA